MSNTAELGSSGKFSLSIERTRLSAKYGLSFVMGAVSVLSLPPFFLWPVLFLTLPGLLILIDSISKEKKVPRTLLMGWFFGFGYFVAGLYWIGAAFLVQAEQFALLMPLAVVAFPAFLALFYSLAVLPAAFVASGPARFMALIFGFGAAEWLRGHILTGFPWNAIGYGLTADDGMLQLASIVGIYGLNLLVVLFFASPYLLLSAKQTRKNQAVFGLIILSLITATAWGYYRLNNTNVSYTDGVRLRLVQPNIPQKEKMDPQSGSSIFEKLQRLSKGRSLEGVTHIIWPEVAVRAYLAREEFAKKQIADLLPLNVNLITGSLRYENNKGAYNSLIAFDHQAKVTAVYDKIHLVPFGEYLPFQKLLESIGLEQLTRQKGGFLAGNGKRWVNIDGVPPFSPLICYEVVFSNNVYNTGQRPGWLLNITNDAWFGNSTGPHQHFHQARVRGVEEGLPVIRVANTGISGVISPYGVVLKKLDYDVEGIIDFGLPAALPNTIYSQWRWYIFVILIIVSILLTVALNKKQN